MSLVKCPSCGQVINVPEKKSGTGWAVGCIVGLVALFVGIAVIGLLAAIAVPSFVKARETARTAACINNLRLLDAAKEQVSLEQNYEEGQVVTREEVSPYIPRGMDGLTCPAGGEYTLNPLGEDPECSVHGSLEDAADR